MSRIKKESWFLVSVKIMICEIMIWNKTNE